MEKLGAMPGMKQSIDSFDAQPSVNGGVVVMIGGHLVLDGEENQMKFAQVFHLQQGGPNGWFCKTLSLTLRLKRYIQTKLGIT